MDFLNLVYQAGFSSPREFGKKRALPIVVLTLALAGCSFFLLGGGLFLLVPIGIFLCGLLIIPVYLLLALEKRKTNVHENIHIFITYIGAISTLDLGRRKLFEEAAQKKEYGAITQTIQKLVYFSKRWSIGFVKICRKLAIMEPSRIFSEFLDRMSSAVDFGESLDVFFWNEQKAVMDDYDTEYKKSLEWIATARDMYMSLLISAAFVIVCAVMMPFFIQYSVTLLLMMSFLFMLCMNALLFVFIESFIPKSKICHSLEIKDFEYKTMLKFLIIIVPFCVILFLILFFSNLSIPVVIAVSVTPLAFIGYLSIKRETTILKRDNEFPGFIRSLGGSMSARGGSLIGTLSSLRVHDFGLLNENIELLFRRLKLETDAVVSWTYFIGECGSQAINEFCGIFVDVTRLGGDPQKACVIISENFSRLLQLRRFRLQAAGSFKGMSYGSLLAVAGTVYAGVDAMRIIYDTVADMVKSLAETPTASSLVGSILYLPEKLNVAAINDMIFIILTLQVAFTAFIIKMVDGGSKYSALIDFVIMVWLLLITQSGVNYLLGQVLGF